jgi:hypothetical protein
VTLSDTDWEDPPAAVESPVDQNLLIETARRRLKARLNRAADAQIAAALDGAEPEAENAVPGMAEAVAAALRELEDDQLEEAAATAGAALEPASDNDEPKLYFETLPDFVSKFLTQAYRSEIRPRPPGAPSGGSTPRRSAGCPACGDPGKHCASNPAPAPACGGATTPTTTWPNCSTHRAPSRAAPRTHTVRTRCCSRCRSATRHLSCTPH